MRICSEPADDAAADAPAPTAPPTGARTQQAELTICPDGPILVRGDFELRSADGTPLPRTRATMALCRCGLSRLAPLCDGTHKVAGFRCGDRVASGVGGEEA